jgi:hypothetical protein
MTIMVDPTFMMTRRGQAWLFRGMAREPPVCVRCPRTYIAFTSHSIARDRRPYWYSVMRSWNLYDDLSLDRVANVLPVDGDANSSYLLHLDRLGSLDARVISEIWSGLTRGYWLVARRPATFDALVQVGVRVVSRGPDDYWSAFRIATSDLPSDIADPLDRRTRFVANVSLPADGFIVPTLSLYDGGRDSYK